MDSLDNNTGEISQISDPINLLDMGRFPIMVPVTSSPVLIITNQVLIISSPVLIITNQVLITSSQVLITSSQVLITSSSQVLITSSLANMDRTNTRTKSTDSSSLQQGSAILPNTPQEERKTQPSLSGIVQPGDRPLLMARDSLLTVTLARASRQTITLREALGWEVGTRSRLL